MGPAWHTTVALEYESDCSFITTQSEHVHSLEHRYRFLVFQIETMLFILGSVTDTKKEFH